MTKLTLATVTLAASALLGGCEMDNILSHRQNIPRAELDERALAAKAESLTSRPGVDTTDTLLREVDVVGGTYEFTTPPTVTQVKSATPEFNQFLLYAAKPGPNDKPFVTLTIGPDLKPIAPDGGDLKVDKSRFYALNGLYTQEWTGRTADGNPFCELIVSHGDKGDKLHAIAIARDADQRKLALDILGSIKWTAKK